MTKVPKAKETKVEELVHSITSNKVVGVVCISGIPSPQMQLMRKTLRGKAQLTVAKNTLLTIALQQASQKRSNVDKLITSLDKQCALVTTNLNAFKLLKTMEATKAPSAARGGETAPENITIGEGETSFKPGPIVGEMQKVGIQAAIQDGKVVIKKEKLMVKKGEKISREVAQMLTRFEIFPMIVGLDLRVAYEDGLVYDREILQVDETLFLNNMRLAYAQGMKLVLTVGYASAKTIRPLLQKAYMDARSLAIPRGIVNRETAPFLLAKAHREMLAVASKSKDGCDQELEDALK